MSLVEPDLPGLAGALTDGGMVGLQLPAGALATPHALERLAAVLECCAQLDRPVLVHPGPAGPVHGATPPWWPAVVDYPAQLHAAWWAWHTAGRALLPRLRICFAAGAGLAPLHHERHAVRGGERTVVDPEVYVETSSYGRQAIDALSRALGIDVIVFGTDRPYADAGPLESYWAHSGAAARHAITVTNPTRLLEGEQQA